MDQELGFFGESSQEFHSHPSSESPSKKMMVGFTPEIERIDTKNIGLEKVSPLKYGYLGNKVGPYQF